MPERIKRAVLALSGVAGQDARGEPIPRVSFASGSVLQITSLTMRQPAIMMSALKRTMKTKTPFSGAALERVRETI